MPRERRSADSGRCLPDTLDVLFGMGLRFDLALTRAATGCLKWQRSMLLHRESLHLVTGDRLARPRDKVRHSDRNGLWRVIASREIAPVEGAGMITMYTTPTCSDCTVTKMHLSRMGISYREIDISADDSAARFVQSVNGGRRSVPTLVVDGQAVSLSRFERSRLDAFLARHGLLPGQG